MQYLRLAQHALTQTSGLTVLIWICLFLYVLSIGYSSKSQWDFRIFHTAPAALTTGANPYEAPDPGATNHSLGYPSGLTYLYPPLALYVFEPLSNLPYRTASLIWFGLKLMALAAMMYLWHKNFESLITSWLPIAVLAFGFNAPILKDLTAGNISIFEQLGIWSGFCLLLRNRPYWGGLVIALTAQFKIMPVVFLGLLLVWRPKPDWKPFVFAVGSFVLLLSCNFLMAPDMAEQYLELFSSMKVTNLDERGAINPSSLAFMRDLADKAMGMGVPVGGSIADLAFVTLVVALGLKSFFFIREHPIVSEADRLWLIYLACVLFVLTMPRVKDYSYIIVLVPSLFVLKQLFRGALTGAWYLPLLGVLLIPHVQFGYYYKGILDWFHSYQPWLFAWCLLYYLFRLRADAAWPQEIEVGFDCRAQSTNRS